MKLKSSAYWGFLISALLLGLPSDFAWFRRPFLITLHEFDFTLGLFAHLHRPSDPWIVFAGFFVHIGLLAWMGWSYYQLILNAAKVQSAFKPTDWKNLVPLLAPFLFYITWLSPDVFFYFGTGWIQAAHHFNPYTRLIAEAPDFPNQAVYANIYPTWNGIVTPYGPLFSLFIRELVRLAAGNVLVCLALLKLAYLALHLLNTRVACQIARELKMNERATGIAFLLNPVLLVCCIGCGHNDIILFSCMLAGVLFLLRQQPFACMACFALGAGFKYVPVLIAPCLLVYFLHGDYRPRHLLKISLLAATFGLLTLLPSFLYPNAPANFLRLLTGQDQICTNFLYLITGKILHVYSWFEFTTFKMTLKIIFLIFYALLGIRLLAKGNRITPYDLFSSIILMLYFYFIIGSPEMHEWYVTWFLAFIFWINRNAYFRLGILLSVAVQSLAIFTGLQLALLNSLGWVCIFMLLWLNLRYLARTRNGATTGSSPLF